MELSLKDKNEDLLMNKVDRKCIHNNSKREIVSPGMNLPVGALAVQ